MSLIKKSDVKNHLSARHQNRIHIASTRQPDKETSAPGQALVEQAGFSKDFTADHQRIPAVAVPFMDAGDGIASQDSPSFGPAKV